jgi:plastocyanin
MRVTSGRFATLVVTLAFVTAVGCSDSHKVGGGLSVGGPKDTTDCRLGECTTTTPSTTPTTAKAITTSTARVTPTTKATTATTRAQVNAVYVIKIFPDSAGVQFQPRVATFKVGTSVRWTNTDSVARSVEADNGEFTSPSLAPGASWEYTPAAAGSLNYHDGTRPYAVGTLEVTA